MIVSASSFIQMAKFMKVNCTKAKDMDGENICMRMGIYIKVSGSLGRNLDLDSIFRVKREILQEFGAMITNFMVSIKI